MRWLLLSFALAIAFGAGAPADAQDLVTPKTTIVPVQANPPGPVPEQENPDEFSYQGVPLWRYSKDSENLRLTAEWRWRYENLAGCVGDLRPAIEQAIAEASFVLRLRFIEDPVNGIPIYGNCGTQGAKIGMPAGGGCLCRGFPYENAIDLDVGVITGATTGRPYPMRSQVAIVSHEFFHAWRAWCEQYQWCQRPGGNFAPTRILDIMNTGPLSRHGIDKIEQDRWWRTMGSPELACPDNRPGPNCTLGYGFNGAWYVFACAFHYNASELAVLVDRRDGQGIVFSGVVVPLRPDAKGCQGIGPVEGLSIQVGAEYYIKQQNPASWSVSFNETRVPY